MTNSNTTSSSSSSSPSITIIGTCLFIAVSVCSSAGTVFDSLTTTHDVPPFLAAFWRLFVQNIIQFIPFVLSLKQAWRDDEEYKMMQHWRGEDGGLVLNVEVEDNIEIDDDEHSENVENKRHNDDRFDQSTNRNRNIDRNIDRNSDRNSDSNSDDGLILPKYFKSFPLLFLSGFALGSHFSFWVYSLRYTSITHSLLWVSMGPIVLNFGSWALYLTGQLLLALSCTCRICCTSTYTYTCTSFSAMIVAVKKPSWFETIGAIVGIFGAIIMLLDIKSHENPNSTSLSLSSSSSLSPTLRQSSSHPPSIHGDFAAFLGAVAVCFYLIIGNKLRSWLSIWLYVFPVIGFASLTCLVFALCDSDNPISWTGFSNASVFGFLSRDYFLYVLYLGVGPGILGHTMLSTLLKYISPLIISTSMLFEPVMGSGIGYIFGMQTMPGLFTWIGGIVLLFGLILVVLGENKEKDAEGGTKIDGTLHHHTISTEENSYGSIK